MEEKNKRYLIALSCIEGVGDKSISSLIEHYSSIENIFSDDETSIAHTLKNVLTRNRGKNYNFKKSNILEKAEKIIEDSNKRKIEILSVFDSEYPFNLKQIENPPYVIYVKGSKKAVRRNSIAIVGTRHPQKESLAYAFEMGSVLSSLNITVVSGFAKGIDTSAHLGAITTFGNTIAVLGCGIDYIYPAENVKIFDKITETGLIISEFPIGTMPDRRNFPRRNRIISGLSYAVIMVEASSKSGALITTNYALEQGRDVFIAPYNEKKEAFYGNHKLFKEGAKIAENAFDIISEFDRILSVDEEYTKMRSKYFEGGRVKNNVSNKIQTEKRAQKEAYSIKKDQNSRDIRHNTDIYIDNDAKNDINFTSEENLIYNIVIKNKSIHIDDISQKSDVPIDKLLMTLMQLEIKGAIKQEPGKYYTAEK